VLQLRNAEMPPLPNFKRMNPEIVRGMEANGWGGYENDKWPVRLAVRKSTRILNEGEDKVRIFWGSYFQLIYPISYRLINYIYGQYQRTFPLPENSLKPLSNGNSN